MLEELDGKVGERVAKLMKTEAAMAFSDAAAALTLGIAAVLSEFHQQK